MVVGVRSSTEEFIRRAVSVHGFAFDYSKVNYTNTRTKVTLGCSEHGYFQQVPSSHLQGLGCRFCGYAKVSESKRAICAAAFVYRAQEVHGDQYDYTSTVYTAAKTPVTIRCPVHGAFTQEAFSHLSGVGCPACWTSRRGAALRHSTDDFIASARQQHGASAFDYSKVEYKTSKSKVRIGCSSCGKDFHQIPSNHLSGNGCPRCIGIISKRETAWLDALRVPVRQHSVRLQDGKRAKVVDGFDPSTNTVYAFLGSFWHGDPRSMPPDDVHPISKKKNRDLHNSTMIELEAFQVKGYRVIYIWELDWEAGRAPTVLSSPITTGLY
jgi:hypothetical protein